MEYFLVYFIINQFPIFDNLSQTIAWGASQLGNFFFTDHRGALYLEMSNKRSSKVELQ